MKQKYLLWITIAGLIGIVFGIFYAVFGLEGLPIYQKIVPEAFFKKWSQGLYGASFIGFSILLLLVGRRAIQKKDHELTKILLLGIGAWLVFEAIISIIYGVYINVLVDVAIMVFLSIPLLGALRK
ncbi:hypothetical protein RAAC3_TM7C00001G0956 [Candidatus Saccharibacteria bacterium RAAC3_TM7_1]|nr:hypothetical protein RAAC3_TM7C00001G0956 [Candidatus Saccharibacteria bacterium RAAC3_TM7_1]HCZ28459.1 hypothetical protein [Candidatus Saccharibacteria bacterium]